MSAEIFVQGLKNPTTMAFLGPNDILVLEKDRGTVMRIVNGVILDVPLLDLNVANRHERGLLGIVIASGDDNSTIDEDRYTGKSGDQLYVYLYFTKGETGDGEDNGPDDGHKISSNSLYRYVFLKNGNTDSLVNPKLVFELPPSHHTFHNGGALLVGPDKNIYLGTGDLSQPYKSTVQNIRNSSFPSGAGGILAFTQDGKAIHGINSGILGDMYPLDKYYAYGIRNIFGMDFDPVSGKLWDTENGPFYGDEINIVEPGFNSGWSKVQGIWRPTENLTAGESVLNPDELVTFNQRGKYSSPEFIWKQPVGPTALKFLNSANLGQEYENDMFVGDINNGFLYHFDLVKNRTILDLDDEAGALADKVANTSSELTDVIFGQGFGGITDIEVGPYDGYLYVVSHRHGTIYKIVPLDEE